MTTIKATCPTCGEVGLTPEDIELRVDNLDSSSSYYAFTCPTCVCEVRKPADDRVVRLLMSGGVEVLPIETDAPAPAPRFAGPVITHDDLLDFHHLLQTEHWFDQLLETVQSS